MLFPVILSGGFGGRLWPVSRASLPKQFIRLLSDKTLMQETILRLRGLSELMDPMLVCNVRHRFIAAEQVRQIDVKPRHIFLEPCGRNTAPAVAVAAHEALSQDPDALLLVLPSDHAILHIPSFHKAVQEAVKLAEMGFLATFGILPTAPKTGYGYIQKGEKINGKGFKVARFVEKPDAATARQYLDSKEYLWNSGIFMFRADLYLSELQRHSRGIYDQTKLALDKTRYELDFSWIDPDAFDRCPDDSIDYAIMEKTDRAAVIPVDMGWSDVGSWGTLWEVINKDSHGNVSDGNVFMKDVSNCFIRSPKEIVATLGIDNLIIIDTPDALLIAHRDKEQEVKDVFKKLM